MKWRCWQLEVMVKYDFPMGCCGGKDSFPPPTDNSDIILLNHVCIINKNNTIWIQNLLELNLGHVNKAVLQIQKQTGFT